MNPLIRLIPPALVRFFARPYVAGDSLEKAADVAAELFAERQLHTTLDLLAEGINRDEVVQRNIQTYLRMVEMVASDSRFPSDARPSISLKMSSYTTDPMDEGGQAHGAREAVFQISEHARAHGVDLTLDMESRHWTDFTLETLRQLHEQGHRHVGGVLQTRLNRTEQDLCRLPQGLRVRLVIGIYREPADCAITDKAEMKERLLRYSALLFDRGHFVEFATHDEVYCRRFLNEVVEPRGVSPDRYELQLLYGVPRSRLLAEASRRGVKVRLYVPFAEGWPMAIAYLRRRLDEYPAMALLVLRNCLRRA